MDVHVQALRDALTSSGISTFQLSHYVSIDWGDIEYVLAGRIPLIEPVLQELLVPTGFVFTDRLLAHPRFLEEDRTRLNYALAVATKLRHLQHQDWLDAAREQCARHYMQAGLGLGQWRVERWGWLIEGDLEKMIAVLIDYGPMGRDMRQVAPFAGLLDQHEHDEVLALSYEQGEGTSWSPVEDYMTSWRQGTTSS